MKVELVITDGDQEVSRTELTEDDLNEIVRVTSWAADPKAPKKRRRLLHLFVNARDLARRKK